MLTNNNTIKWDALETTKQSLWIEANRWATNYLTENMSKFFECPDLELLTRPEVVEDTRKQLAWEKYDELCRDRFGW